MKSVIPVDCLRPVPVVHRRLQLELVIADAFNVLVRQTVLGPCHAAEHPTAVVAIDHHFPVGVEHAVNAVPTVIHKFHVKVIWPVLIRKHKSTKIPCNLTQLAVTKEVPRRIRRLPQMAFGDVCRFYAHVGLDLLFEIRGSLYCLTAVFIFPNTATTIGMVTSGLPRSLNG